MKDVTLSPCFKCSRFGFLGNGDAICIKEKPKLIMQDWVFDADKACKLLKEWLGESVSGRIKERSARNARGKR